MTEHIQTRHTNYLKEKLKLTVFRKLQAIVKKRKKKKESNFSLCNRDWCLFHHGKRKALLASRRAAPFLAVSVCSVHLSECLAMC